MSEMIHRGKYNEQRRNVVLWCDNDRVIDHHYVTDYDEAVTCQLCLEIIREGQESLAEMQRIVERGSSESLSQESM